jgi:hypothetical protein
MKKRWPLLLLLLVLAALAFWLWRTNTGNTLAGPLTDFAVPDTAAVDRIFIAEKGGGTADLRRTDNGWTVNGVPAKDFQVDILLRTFKLVELRAPVPRSAEQNVLRVMAGMAKKVEIYQGGKKPVKIWWVGQSTKDHFGTYMVLEVPGKGRSSVPYVMGMSGFTGILTTRFTTDMATWRSTVVTEYPDLTKVTRVQVDNPGDSATSFTITYAGGNDLKLLNNRGVSVPIDSAKVKDLLLHLRRSNYEYIETQIDKARRDSVLASTPWHVLTITSDAGVQRIPFWRKPPPTAAQDMEHRPLFSDKDRMFALLNDTSLVVVQRQWFDFMTPTIDELRAKKAMK